VSGFDNFLSSGFDVGGGVAGVDDEGGVADDGLVVKARVVSVQKDGTVIRFCAKCGAPR